MSVLEGWGERMTLKRKRSPFLNDKKFFDSIKSFPMNLDLV